MVPIVKFLADLIAIPSVNPAFAPPGGPHSGEERVAALLHERARAVGMDCEYAPVLPGRSNLIVRLAPAQARRRILLAPHLDTVGGLEIPGNLFTPVLKDARLFGRGACDT